MFIQSALVLASLAASALAGSSSGGGCSITKSHRMTFYGYPDNDPAGAQVRYNCGGRGGKAGGSGTYENPLTMAAEQGQYSQCELVYSPYLKKYLRVEDSCANCYGDWVDVWLGPTDHDAGKSLMSCQHTLTGTDAFSHTIIRAPPAGLEVNSAELYSNGQCHIEACSLAANEISTCNGASAPSTPKAPETPKTPEAPKASEAPKAPVEKTPIEKTPVVKSPVTDHKPSDEKKPLQQYEASPAAPSASPSPSESPAPHGRSCRIKYY